MFMKKGGDEAAFLSECSNSYDKVCFALVLASGAVDDAHGAEANEGNLAALALGDERDGVYFVFEAPCYGDGGDQFAHADSCTAGREGDFAFGFVDHDDDEVVAGEFLVLLHAVVEGDNEGGVVAYASGHTEVHHWGVAQGVDVGEVDGLGGAIHFIADRDLLGDGVAAAHGLRFAGEEGAKLGFGKVAAQVYKRSEEATLRLLGGGVGVGDFESLGSHNIFVIDLAASHVAGAAFDTAHPGGLNFHGFKGLRVCKLVKLVCFVCFCCVTFRRGS